jgi:hypothetical protein
MGLGVSGARRKRDGALALACREVVPMKKRSLWGGLAAAAVLLSSGVAFSGGTATTVDELMDFDETTQQLWAYPQQAPLTVYLQTPQTRHLLAEIGERAEGFPGQQHPPDPCHILAVSWNFVVRFDRRTGQNSTQAFAVILNLMGTFSCSAELTSTDGAPAPLVSIKPLP